MTELRQQHLATKKAILLQVQTLDSIVALHEVIDVIHETLFDDCQIGTHDMVRGAEYKGVDSILGGQR
jgi:hypothetical protein